MDGLFFYWVIWMAWVCMMFFVPKSVPFRVLVLFHLLVVMVLARYIVTIDSFSMQVSGVYIFGVVCVMIRKHSIMKLSVFVCYCILMALAYASFYLFVLLDPVWVMIKPVYMLCVLMNYLAWLLMKEWKGRLVVLVTGMLLGDMLYAGLLTAQFLPYVSLSFAWHDTLALVMIVQLSSVCLAYSRKWVHQQLNIHFFITDKQAVRR